LACLRCVVHTDAHVEYMLVCARLLACACAEFGGVQMLRSVCTLHTRTSTLTRTRAHRHEHTRACALNGVCVCACA
jgi:hypothetical protein